MDTLTTQAADVAAVSDRYLSPILGRYYARTWSHGEGHRLFDADGRAYLDFACGIAVTSLGHRHPAVTAAIHEQVDKLLHICNAEGYVEPVARLAKELADAFPDPLDTVFFGNSGSEAIEAALKLARRVTGRPGIIAFSGAFHGRTFGAASITTSNVNYRTGYEPLLPGVHVLPFPRAYADFAGDEDAATRHAIAHLKRTLGSVIPASSVASIIVEPVQGEGGYIPAPAAFLQQLRQICDENGILLICDEVQSGFGRTGKMWAFEHAGIIPDVVTMAKAIANGMPLGAIITRRELQERWGKGAHGTTFGGNPVSCAAGVAVMETIRGENLVANAAAMGDRLKAGLRELAAVHPIIGDVRGRGLMIGVELVKSRETREPDGANGEAVLALCADEGLLVLNCGPQHNVIRWIPPLDVTAAEIDESLAVFDKVLRSLPAESVAV